MNRMRRSRGFTLIEVLVTVVIMAAVFLGFVALLYDMAEQMHISWQLRNAEEFGAWYVHKFSSHIRNGTTPTITRITTPSEMEVGFYSPDQYMTPEGLRDLDIWEFEYDFDTQLPQIRVDDVVQTYEYWPPLEPHPRDEFYVDPSTFLIEDYKGLDLPLEQENFREDYYTIYFEITYRRHSSIPGQGVYERVIPVTGSAYVMNDNWPDIKPPAGLGDDE